MLDRHDHPVHERVTFIQLEPHHCRYPIGTVGEATFGFCGKPKHTGPYCEAHARACYVAPSPVSSRLVRWLFR
jgi:hypothetical protein